MKGKQNLTAKKIVESYVNGIWNRKDLSALDHYLDENIKIHSLSGDFQGVNHMKQIVESWLKGFPNLKVNILAFISEDNYVVLHWNAIGNHLGEFKGILPTGVQVNYNGVSIFKITNNKICEYWAYLDMNHVLKQIG